MGVAIHGGTRQYREHMNDSLMAATALASAATGLAYFDGRLWWGVLECIDVRVSSERLRCGSWVVVVDFEGRARAWRFAHSERVSEESLTDLLASSQSSWQGPGTAAWDSSMDRAHYQAAVDSVRSAIYEGDVYQANICRVLSAAVPLEPSALALSNVLRAGNPAPYGGFIQIPQGIVSALTGEPVDSTWVVSASPELYLRLDGATITSAPIKGTATTKAGLSAKDESENVMITDLVRNDLQRVCEAGSIEVIGLLQTEDHPGLVHLVSTVQGQLRADLVGNAQRWLHVLDATFPPGSVSGAPKESALRIISALETVPRGPYCGAVGWIDGDSDTAELAVGIRTFWWERSEHGDGWLRFGTGAGITWGSDPLAEWEETELKARRLISLASSGGIPGGTDGLAREDEASHD